MARLNLDEVSRHDPRVLRLARTTGELRQTTLGRLVDVWWCCYHRKTAILDADDVDMASELDGFGDLMVASKLAERVPGGLRIMGATERIDYLLEQSERGRRGGLARSANEALAKQTLSVGQANAKRGLPDRLSLPLAPSQPPSPSPPPPPPQPPPHAPDRERSTSPTATHTIGQLWDLQERLRSEVIPGSRRMSLTADRRRRIESLLKSGYSPEELEAVVHSYAREERSNGGGWFNGDTNWRPDNVSRALGRIGTHALITTSKAQARLDRQLERVRMLERQEEATQP